MIDSFHIKKQIGAANKLNDHVPFCTKLISETNFRK